MVNRIKRDVLLAIIAEWLEESDIPPLIPRHQSDKEPINLIIFRMPFSLLQTINSPTHPAAGS
jgi:hypothetical protein